MKSLKRAIPFLLLNILVSAVTTLAVLNWWGGGLRLTQQPEPTVPAGVLNPTSVLPDSSQPVQPLATLAADSSGRVIEIQDVVGPGDLNNESVLLRRLGEGDLPLAGWKLDDGGGHSYLFPQFILNKAGAVQVNTRSGTDTAIALFWGRQEAVWTSGKTVTLYDPQGNIQALFTIK